MQKNQRFLPYIDPCNGIRPELRPRTVPLLLRTAAQAVNDGIGNSHAAGNDCFLTPSISLETFQDQRVPYGSTVSLYRLAEVKVSAKSQAAPEMYM